MTPKKLKKGDEIRIIAPARSLALINNETRTIANNYFKKIGLKISFSKNCEIIDGFSSSSIDERISDLHEAFSDRNVKGILTVIGGHNSNQLLKYIDYDLIKKNPKIVCGFSDITALANAIYAKTGLVTYSGPHYSTFGMKKGIEYTSEYFKKCLFENEDIKLNASLKWSDDQWFLNQENRVFHDNTGYKIINKGRAKGKIIGGNLCTLNLLQGTEFMPDLTDSILFIEDDELTFKENFDRDLQSLIQQPNFNKVRAVIIGRFQIASEISEGDLFKIIKSKSELEKLPVVYNVDFGHTTPHITFPIGGFAEVCAEDEVTINIKEH
ncbi:Muramoyltetrapeptide carboxypeptidase LdcA (peptidoglycan recycling) [Clostridium acidisoli DSM 12555]|uniref:Muramoyltetrapeptide carboxypeptidase LdcA (Peptidoglycan recycling) n=1 Tax=Clostridium acidisoli DSM 12555 TaxID=1121291 RepID=A0A1W1XEF5_9CLOT|nr:S66 peptidase family protein [Clostridium acidisoli]SMC21881.1 Muramoyltetrapeptide carboxypeptidase LdcA (peptidoglycan recycling) [Clostridium acidisoli DSM 12555]